MALKGIRVIEMAGLAPAPFCGMILSDFGADVIRVDRTGPNPDMDTLARGKRSIAVNMKKPKGVELVRKMCSNADVVLEPFRKGVMEKFGLGPGELLKENPRLVYARMTGFGQSGPWSVRAGHDINYLALSGVLSMLGRSGQPPTPPINLLADFAGGGLFCAFGITMALLERSMSGKGQVVDANMVEGAAYIGSFLFKSQHLPFWGQPRGENILDGGAPYYQTYKTKDGKYMSVGAIEPQFYAELIKGLGLSAEEAPQHDDAEEIRNKFSQIFATKTREEWCAIFDPTDACVAPVLKLQEAGVYSHNKVRESFLTGPDGIAEPAPAPQFSRTPAEKQWRPLPSIGQHTEQVLGEIGYSEADVQLLKEDGVVEQGDTKSKL